MNVKGNDGVGIFFKNILILTIIFSFFAAPAAATHTITSLTLSTTGNDIYIKSGEVETFNFTLSINSTGDNITQVNITIPTGFNVTHTYELTNWTNTTYEEVALVVNATYSNSTAVNHSFTNIFNMTITLNSTAPPDGNYTFNVTTLDNSSEIQMEQVNVTVDNAPIVNISSPLNDTIADHTPLLNVTFLGETVNFAWYSVDGGANSTPVGAAANLTLNLTYLANGLHNVTVSANDSRGNLNVTTRYFTVSTTTINVPVDLPTIQAAVGNASAGDTILVAAGTYVENVDITKALNIVGDGAGTTTVQAALNNDHVFSVTDTNGLNISGFTLSNATVGGTKAGVYLSNSNYSKIAYVNTTNNTYGVYLTSSYHNKIANNTISISSDGIYISSSHNNTIANNTVSSSSNVGIDIADSNYNTIMINDFSTNALSGIYTDGSSYNIIANNTASNNQEGIYIGASSQYNTIANNTATLNTVSGICFQSGSSSNTIYNNYFNNTNNSAFIGTNTNNWNTTKYLETNIVGGTNIGGNFWAYPNGTGFSQTCQDGNDDGICDASYTLNDTGNVDYLPLAQSVGQDSTPPSVTITYPANTTYLYASHPINVTYNDAHPANVTAEVDNSTDGTWDFNITLTNNSGSWEVANRTWADDHYRIRIHANDTAGNVNNSEDVYFTVDTTVPDVVITAPTAGINTTNTTVCINASITDTTTSIHTALVDIAGTNYTMTNLSGNYGYCNTSVTDGQQTWRIFANDTMGNANQTETVTFTKDTVVPAVTITAPENGTTTSNTVCINASITDATTSIHTALVDIAGTNYTMTNLSGNYGYCNTSVTDGQQTWRIFANDSAGNANQSETVTFTADVTAPSVTIVSPTNTTTSDNTPLLNATFGETVNYTWYSINGTTNSTPEASTQNLTVQLQQFSEGQHNITVYANDSLGNVGLSIKYFTVISIGDNTGNITVGTNSTYNASNMTFSGVVVIGNNTIIGNDTNLGNATTTIGDYVVIGNDVTLGTADATTVIIGDYVTLGSNITTLTAGTLTIGANVTLGSNIIFSGTVEVPAGTVISSYAQLTDGSQIRAQSGQAVNVNYTEGEILVPFVRIPEVAHTITDLIKTTNKSTVTTGAGIISVSTNSTSSLDFNITVAANATIPGAAIEVAETTINPENGSATLSSVLGNYLYINASPLMNLSNVENITIRIAIPSGYSSTHMHRYNPTTEVWDQLNNTWTSGSYIYANVSSFSVYAISGSVTPTVPISGRGSNVLPTYDPIARLLSSTLTSSLFGDIMNFFSGIKSAQFYDLAPITGGDSLALASTLISTGEYPDVSEFGVTVARPVKSASGDIYKLSAEKALARFKFAEKVVVARGDLSVDSLAAIAYAKANNIPVLLTKPGELPSETADAIAKLGPRTIIVAGGPEAITDEVAALLGAGRTLERKYGETRYETAVELARMFSNPDVIVITAGTDPNVDAVVTSAAYEAPLIYVGLDEVPKVVEDYIKENPDAKIIYGSGVSEDVKAQIGALW